MDEQKTRQQKIWTLTEDLAYNSGLIYVHSSARNFQKAIKHNGLGDAISDTFTPYMDELINTFQSIKKQVDPKNLPTPKEGTKYDILKMFHNDGRNFTVELDTLKNSIITILHHPAYQKYQEYLHQQKAEVEIQVRETVEGTPIKKAVVKKMSVINPLGIGYNQILSDMDFEQIGTKSGANVAKLLNLDPESNTTQMFEGLFARIYQNYGTQRVTGLRQKANRRIAATILGQQTPLREKDFLKVFNQLFIHLKSAIQNSSYESSYNFFTGLKDLNSILAKSGQVFTNLGNLYEDAIIVLLRHNPELQQKYGTTTVRSVGTSSANKWNASDIEIDLHGIDEFQTSIGASIKQQQDFTKGVNLTVDNLLQLDIGPKITPKMLNQYKYFMLNYSLISTQEDLGRVGKNKRNSLFSLSEFRDTKAIIDNFMGKLIFMRALVGPILFNTKNSLSDRVFTKTTSQGESIAPPYILVTQKYACFTYDLLQAANDLMTDRTIDIQLAGVKYSKTSTSTLKKLHGAKINFLDAAKKNNSLLEQDYATLIADGEVQSHLSNLNRSAFGDEQNSLNMDVVINTSKLINKLQNQIQMR